MQRVRDRSNRFVYERRQVNVIEELKVVVVLADLTGHRIVLETHQLKVQYLGQLDDIHPFFSVLVAILTGIVPAKERNEYKTDIEYRHRRSKPTCCHQ